MKTYKCLPSQIVKQDPYEVIPVQASHIEQIRQWRNDQMEILRQAAPITREQQQHYYEKTIWPEMATECPTNILVSYLLRDEPIGYGGLVHIAWDHRRAEISFLAAPERASHPTIYARDFSSFLALIKTIAFEMLGFHRLFTETYAVRPNHIAILENAGFIREGIMRHHVRIQGRPVDSIIHGCLDDYEK